MGLDAVVAEIRDKGRIESEAINKEASKAKDDILKEAQQKAEAIKLLAKEEATKTTSNIISQEEASGHLVAKREILNAQKELLDEVYEKSLEMIEAMPESFHENVITSLMHKAILEIPKGSVSCNARDEKVLKKLLKEPDFSNYTFGKSIRINGGIIVESSDGLFKIDFSYGTFLSQVWESGLKDASDILFT